MTDSYSDFLMSIASVYRSEHREDAHRTSDALIDGEGNAFVWARSPCVFDRGIADCLATSKHPVAQIALANHANLPWGSNPVADQMGSDFVEIFAVATCMGPDGPIHCPDYRLGLFYQAPNTYYELHAHNAVETYAIIAGSAIWTAGDDTRERSTGDMIHHPSLMPHAFQAGPDGFVALWRWSGDIAVDSYHFVEAQGAMVA